MKLNNHALVRCPYCESMAVVVTSAKEETGARLFCSAKRCQRGFGGDHIEFRDVGGNRARLARHDGDTCAEFTEVIS